MYTKEQKLIAVELFIKYDKRIAPVVRELNYPDRKSLHKWYNDYIENNNQIIITSKRSSKYSLYKKSV